MSDGFHAAGIGCFIRFKHTYDVNERINHTLERSGGGFGCRPIYKFKERMLLCTVFGLFSLFV